MAKNEFINDFEKKFNNKPSEQSAVRNRFQNKEKEAIRKHEENQFSRMRLKKTDIKRQRKMQRKWKEGEKVDDFRELNDIKHYFDDGKQENATTEWGNRKRKGRRPGGDRFKRKVMKRNKKGKHIKKKRKFR